MDYSASNTGLWSPMVQLGLISAAVLISNFLVRKVSFVKKLLMPTAVLAGFILLGLRTAGLITLNASFLEGITYHGIAIGFIAMSLRIPDKQQEDSKLVGMKSGAVIVSSYMIQAIVGLIVSLGLAYTLKPDMFKAAGILLPMGYGQGPGQANNVGTTYETLGMVGGHSFALALAATGYICACTVGVFYTAFLSKKGKFKRAHAAFKRGSVSIDVFQDDDEIPITESVDRLSIQIMMIIVVYALTYLITWAVTSLISKFAPGLGATVNSLLWGFNFIFGSAFATLTRTVLTKLKNANIMTHQYQNNYLLSRISGLAFDVMIIAGIASIEIGDLKGLWIPFILMAALGAIVTLIHLSRICRKVYPRYYYESLVSMYGMMTGTISSGVLLLRELDPNFKTPAANNLVIGSSYGVLFGAPLLILIGLAPKSDELCLVTLGLVIIYYIFLVGLTRIKPKKDKLKNNEGL